LVHPVILPSPLRWSSALQLALTFLAPGGPRAAVVSAFITRVGFMAVYTEVSLTQASALFESAGLGPLTRIQGCSGGIENTNYFADTAQARYVLTLFERLTATQLPYYLRLMAHLAAHGIAVPNPAADARGEVLHSLCGKPAAIVNLLTGASELAPSPAHCTEVGSMLARMHLAGRSFVMQQDNLRGLAWWNQTVPVVLPYLQSAQASLLQSELAHQNQVATLADYAELPRGPIHADLFRDNVMFAPSTSPSAAPVLTGFFDFYFAGNDVWVFDIAVTLNDWCVDLDSGAANPERTQAFLSAYEAVRPLEAAERRLLSAMLRAAALRFWLSRLWDWYLPREASMLKPHDPTRFERLLRQRISHPDTCAPFAENFATLN
jgi:homoserine kinase type II